MMSAAENKGDRSVSVSMIALVPEQSRRRRVRIVPVKALVMIGIVASAVVGCGVSDSKEVDTAIVSEKPDLPDLSDGMVIPESAYPPVEDGEFFVTSVRPIEAGGDEEADACSPASWMQGGDQEAGSRVVSESTNARYQVEVFALQCDIDVPAWASDCLPRPEGGYTMDVQDLPGLPSGFLGAGLADETGPRTYTALGYVRGIFVAASIGRGSDGMPNGAKSDLVNLVNQQVQLLEAY